MDGTCNGRTWEDEGRGIRKSSRSQGRSINELESVPTGHTKCASLGLPSFPDGKTQVPMLYKLPVLSTFYQCPNGQGTPFCFSMNFPFLSGPTGSSLDEGSFLIGADCLLTSCTLGLISAVLSPAVALYASFEAALSGPQPPCHPSVLKAVDAKL